MIPRILDLINTTLITVVRPDLNVQGKEPPLLQIERRYGKRAVEFNGPTPRIVWTYATGKVTPTKHIGVNPHQGHSLSFDVVAHCFHKTEELVLNLVNDLLSATRITLCEPSLLNAEVDLIDPGEETVQTFAADLRMTIDVTILDPGLNYIQVKQVNADGQFVDIQPQF
jgi:hypothetical protein